MLFESFRREDCVSYLVACPAKSVAALVDPVLENEDEILQLLQRHSLSLVFIIDTHTHADHVSRSRELREITGAQILMHKYAPTLRTDWELNDGDEIPLGDATIEVLHTPGHTIDSITLRIENRLLTGDTLLIGGTGRTDLPGGNPKLLYKSLWEKILTLEDGVLVYPSHEYEGKPHSTLGEEKAKNPRLQVRPLQDFVTLMNQHRPPLPRRIEEALRENTR